MAITESTLLAGARPQYQINKPTSTSEGAGTWQSLWKLSGMPSAGATPPVYTAGSGYVPDRATAGALGQVNAAGGNELRLIALEAGSTVAGKLIIYDRLWACSNFVTNSTSLQSVTTPGTLTSGRLQASGDYSDVEAWLEVYTAPGATGATWTVVANDGAGASQSYTYTHPANAETINQMMPLNAPSGAAADTQTEVSDLNTVEDLLVTAGCTECDFTNYARKNLSRTAWAEDDTNDRANAVASILTWTAAGGASNNTVLGAFFYDATTDTNDTTRQLISVDWFATGVATNGGDWSYDPSSNFYRLA